MTPEPFATSAMSVSSAPAAVVHGCKDSSLAPTAGNIDRVIAATLCLINKERAAHGLASVHTNAALKKAAGAFSKQMVAQSFFGHVSPSGEDLLHRLRAAGYIKPNHGFTVGENIAAAGGSLATPAAIVAAWMNSPQHRANILSAAFKDTGIGVVAALPGVAGSGPGATYTQDFGTVT
jgi:uncharacterized protein YkwD